MVGEQSGGSLWCSRYERFISDLATLCRTVIGGRDGSRDNHLVLLGASDQVIALASNVQLDLARSSRRASLAVRRSSAQSSHFTARNPSLLIRCRCRSIVSTVGCSGRLLLLSANEVSLEEKGCAGGPLVFLRDSGRHNCRSVDGLTACLAQRPFNAGVVAAAEQLD